MKKNMKILLILSMGALLTGCNEKISPALEAGNSSTTVPSAVAPDEYYFKVTNTSNPLLGYILHRTGSAYTPTNPKCEIKSTNPLSSAAYFADSQSNPSHDDKVMDISCYFEAEELSLNHSGFKFDVQASPNTCAYIGYAPFSFYENKPGNSTASYTLVKCGDEVGDCAGAAATAGDTVYGAGSLATNEQYVDTSIVSTDRTVQMVANESDLCTFNYQEQKCDEGVITINEIIVTRIPEVQDVESTAANEYVAAYDKAENGETRSISCGGNHLNCVQGPITKLSAFTRAAFTEIKNTTYNEAYKEEYSYDGDLPKSNRRWVNFRRNLANPEIDLEDSDPLEATYTTSYITEFAGETSFQPMVYDLYSRNLRWDKVTKVVSSSQRYAEKVALGRSAEPYAAEPFLGFDSRRVNPFYTFYCFDQALEIRARIRMVVREWDRVFDKNSSTLTLISDISNEGEARQDYPVGYISENPGDPDEFNEYNDISDWDDLLVMTRTPGVVSGTTLWEPKTGWFNSALFVGY
jgi:hypothetical protein